jgi:hypothetical protein
LILQVMVKLVSASLTVGSWKVMQFANNLRSFVLFRKGSSEDPHCG